MQESEEYNKETETSVPPRSKFLYFHAVFGKKWSNIMLTPPQGLAPPHL